MTFRFALWTFPKTVARADVSLQGSSHGRKKEVCQNGPVIEGKAGKGLTACGHSEGPARGEPRLLGACICETFGADLLARFITDCSTSNIIYNLQID